MLRFELFTYVTHMHEWFLASVTHECPRLRQVAFGMAHDFPPYGVLHRYCDGEDGEDGAWREVSPWSPPDTVFDWQSYE